MDGNGIPPWEWVPRDVEAKLRVLSSRPGCFIHVRGRRRMGKSSTVKRVLDSRDNYFVLHEGDNFPRIRDWLRGLGIPVNDSLRGEGDLAKPLCAAIRIGHVLVCDEIYRASPALQCALQDVVDTITYEIEQGVPSSTYGGLVVLGSHPILVDEVLEGSHRPLFRRFLSKITILPFLASEMAHVFARYGIASAMTQLATYATTGCCPLFIRSLVEAGAFVNDAGTAQFAHALFASHAQSQREAVVSFYRDELRLTHATAFKELYSDQCRSSEPAQLSAIAKRLGFSGDSVRAKGIVSALEARHGSVRLLQPIAPSLAQNHAGQSIKTQYAVTDAPLRTFHSLYAQTAGGGVHALSATASTDSVSTHEGHLLEEWVRQLIHERAAAKNAPLPVGSLAELSQPEVVWGTWAGFSAVEIDVVVFFHKERIAVLGTVKRDPVKALSNWSSLFAHAARLTNQLKAVPRTEGPAPRNEGCLLEYTRAFVAFAPSFSPEQQARFETVRERIAADAQATGAAVGPGPAEVLLCGLDDLLRFPVPPPAGEAAAGSRPAVASWPAPWICATAFLGLALLGRAWSR